eukprot:TRINITY_DN4329_c0_g1_i3.p1 TRINITY_DN4329_c0_g1~~TRINITY_DN4329_c0_g1_i3.p1  ORF type:complete len:186 (+),score=53.25 TRINITY_DN4329_c0_g1_i3:56-613(+)
MSDSESSFDDEIQHDGYMALDTEETSDFHASMQLHSDDSDEENQDRVYNTKSESLQNENSSPMDGFDDFRDFAHSLMNSRDVKSLSMSTHVNQQRSPPSLQSFRANFPQLRPESKHDSFAESIERLSEIPPLTQEKSTGIKEAMSKFSLPQSQIPDWAKAIPEDKWLDMIVEKTKQSSKPGADQS